MTSTCVVAAVLCLLGTFVLPSDSAVSQVSELKNVLPRGCWIMNVPTYADGRPMEIVLSSTSEWRTYQQVTYTFGIVFVEANDMTLPVSLTGAEILLSNHTAAIHADKQRSYSGQGSALTERRTGQCVSTSFTDSQLHKFIEANSFLKSLFSSISNFMPNWFIFKARSKVTSTLLYSTEFMYGQDVRKDRTCNGAPVFEDHLYGVFKIGGGFMIGSLEDILTVSQLNTGYLCLIIDLTQGYGGSTFFILPKEVRAIVGLAISKFIKVAVEPRGFGISTSKGINAHHLKKELTLWNGQHMFTYPLFENANLWVGIDLGLSKLVPELVEIKAEIDIYEAGPSFLKMLRTKYIEERNELLSVSAAGSLDLKLEVSDQNITIPLQDIATLNIDLLMSIGGIDNRVPCGEIANPQGTFLSAVLNVNPFRNIEILQDLNLLDNNRKVYVYHMFGQTTKSHQATVDLIDELISLQNALHDFQTFIETTYKYSNISSTTHDKLSGIELTIRDSISAIRVHMPIIKNKILMNCVDVMDEVLGIVSELKSAVVHFCDSEDLTINLADALYERYMSVDESMKKAVNSLDKKASNPVTGNDGFGLKFQAHFHLLNIELAQADIEMLNSRNLFSACDNFNGAYELLKGQYAVRFIAYVNGGIPIVPSLELGKGSIKVEMAFAVNSKQFHIRTRAFVTILGNSVNADLHITNTMAKLNTLINIWNIFQAHVDVEATRSKHDWHDLAFHVKGKLIAKDNSKDDSFESSYLDAMKAGVQMLSKEATERLDRAQHALSDAQKDFSNAQDWLQEKKEALDKANNAFDSVMAKLDGAKRSLENAKRPYFDALNKLDSAQRSVDRLCKIKTCSRICVPGVVCKICTKKVGWVTVKYPCCSYTSCMVRIPDPICVSANALCTVARAAAYAALELAKLAVKSTLVAFDVAKAALSVAQVAVDKSRVVLDVAKGVLTIAQSTLESMKHVFEVAKLALEAVKVTIATALKVVELTITHGLQQLLDVRNCGFNMELARANLKVIEISCEVRAFMMDWKTIGVRIDFDDIDQSIWQAAKATIDTMMDRLKIFQLRRRRDVSFKAMAKMHSFIKHARSSRALENSTEYLSRIIDTLPYSSEFVNVETKCVNRIEHFRIKCKTMTNALQFLKDGFMTLLEISDEAKTSFELSILAKSNLYKYSKSSLASNISLENSGIDTKVALSDYNITEAELNHVLEEGKRAVLSDPMLVEIDETLEVASASIDDEMSATESAQLLKQWLYAMENSTNSYFNESECIRFRDCVYHSIYMLYDIHTEEKLPGIDDIRSTISALEYYILDMFQNSSSSITDTFHAASAVMDHLNRLSSSSLFCSTPPIFDSRMKDVTAVLGTPVALTCHVSADPAPTFWWFKDGDLVPGQTDRTLAFPGVAMTDAGVYQCTAGNVVANVSSDEIRLIVVHAPDTVKSTGKKDSTIPIPLLAGLLAACCFVIICAVAAALYLKRTKPSNKKREVAAANPVKEKC